jgi:uncharacterized protein YeeX (DUF496 family)
MKGTKRNSKEKKVGGFVKEIERRNDGGEREGEWKRKIKRDLGEEERRMRDNQKFFYVL